jgi:diguanylate cyclase (GGDEF)-like protein/PAS domain S-box-containing protein
MPVFKAAAAQRYGLRAVIAIAGILSAARAGAASARFTRISVEQGLSQNSVQSILQDHAGFLWIATEEGLDRYDGYGFVVFKHDPNDAQTLPDDVVSVLHEDRQQRLWVGTQRGLSLFDRRTETFSHIGAIQKRVTSFWEDEDGTIWVGTAGGGLFERDRATGAFRQYQPNPKVPDTLTSAVVTAVRRDHRGRLWVGTQDAGLCRLEEGADRRFVPVRHDPADPRSLGHEYISGLGEDRQGDLWVTTYGGGISVLDHETDTFRRYAQGPNSDPHGLATDLLTPVFVDRAGEVWIGTDGQGLQRYDRAGDRFLPPMRHEPSDPASISSSVVRSIYEDAQGQIWVGTYRGGISVLKRPRHAFAYYGHIPGDPTSLADGNVGAVSEDAEHRIWVSTDGTWLHRFDRATGTFTRYEVPRPNGMRSSGLSIHEDRKGRLWLATYRGGLYRFDPQKGAFTAYPHRAGDPTTPSHDDIWTIAEDDGGLWLGTGAGLDRFDPDRGIVVGHTPLPGSDGTLSYGGVRGLLVDSRGDLWAGSLDGLNVLRHGARTFLHYRHDEANPRSLSNDRAACLYEDRRGRLWVGTQGGGLNLVDPQAGTFTAYRDFPSNVIYAIDEDPSGRLWLSTNHGLARFDPESGRKESFDLTNGLQGLLFHIGAHTRTHDGRLLFGSADGLYDFDPSEIRPDNFAPPVAFTSLRVFNEPARLPAALQTLDEVTLTHRDQVFSLAFAALDYTFPRRNQYAYSMTGFKDRWIDLGTRREVTFTDLAPGTYTFRIKASNSDGIWNPGSTASLRVVVRPPFWSTWWFRTLGVATFALGLLTIHGARVRRLTTALRERRRSEAALRRAEEKYRAIFENALEGISQSTPEGRLLTANPALARMLGYPSPEAMVAEITDAATQLYADPLRRREMKRIVEAEGMVQSFECQFRRRNGQFMWISQSVRAARDEAGTVQYYEATIEDITERRRSEGEVRHTVSVLQSILESTADGILVVDRGGKVVSFNHRFAQIWGLSADELNKDDDSRIIARCLHLVKDSEPFLARIRQLYSQPDAESFDLVEFKDGRVIERYSAPHRLDGQAVGRAWSFRDITERRRAEEKVEFHAYHDALTSLPNRRLLKDRLAQAYVYAHRHGHHLALIFLDIDHFKLINDTLGHATGDHLLQGVADRLRACLRQGDTVARVGGDEFTVLFPDVLQVDDAARMAEKILQTFAQPFVIDGQELYVTASIGFAIYPQDGEDPDTLLRNADSAMYRAKELGRNNYQPCTPGMNARLLERMSLERSLRRAVERGEFTLHYQPLVNLGDGRVVGTEALVRWQHPERGLLYPGKFIPVAEESRLILPLGEWVLNTACAQLASWRAAGYFDLRLSVNLSARQFQQQDIHRTVEAALRRAGLPASALELEITESMAMHNVERTREVLHALRDMGVRISIDDFGTGQSSLSYLKHFPLNTLKIDQSFVRDIAVDPDDEAIVRAVIALAHILKLSVIAEGVETVQQRDFVRGAGCEEAQGYFFSRPMSPDLVTEILARSPRLDNYN